MAGSNIGKRHVAEQRQKTIQCVRVNDLGATCKVGLNVLQVIFEEGGKKDILGSLRSFMFFPSECLKEFDCFDLMFGAS
jgi:hypothetical protein